MERIHFGWLTKSPQQRKASGPWKLFQARWKRRYFVLYAPPASTLLPGTCSAVLDYYDSDRQLFKKGTIDLTNCVEVKLRPDIDVYKNVFALRTKHRGRDRTYFLYSDTEDDMKHWVECLRAVLFLDGTYNGARDTMVSHSSDNAQAQKGPSERYISLPEQASSSISSTDVRQLSNPSSPAITSARCPSPPVAFEPDAGDANDEQYILLEECFSGPSSGPSSLKSATLPATVSQHPLHSFDLGKLSLESKPLSAKGSMTAGTQQQYGRSSDGNSQQAEYFNLTDMRGPGDAHSKTKSLQHNVHYATVVPQNTYHNNSDELRLPTKKKKVPTATLR